MAYNTKKLAEGSATVVAWLVNELAALRTGRASPALIDTVSVEVYGSFMKLSQVASIIVEDARSLYVTPYDKSAQKDIEKAIMLADLGVSVGSDDRGVRVSFPELTGERRAQLIKLLKSKLEEARVSLRGERTRAMAEVEQMEKDGDMSEDELKRAKVEIQKVIDDHTSKLDELAAKKEKELNA